jgi:hypothetical protein
MVVRTIPISLKSNCGIILIHCLPLRSGVPESLLGFYPHRL